MGDRRPKGEKEFNPLDDTVDLIGQVVGFRPRVAVQQVEPPPATSIAESERKDGTPVDAKEKLSVVAGNTAPSHDKKPTKPAEAPEQEGGSREQMVVFKFHVPRTDYNAVRRILHGLESSLGGRIDLANLGRGWISRLITAEGEILDAAERHGSIKTPNSRNPVEVAEVDHAMAVIQAQAFRRAEPMR